MERLDKAEEFLKQGKYSEAVKLYEEIHAAYPKEDSVLLKLAWAYYDGGYKAKAVACLEELLAKEMQRNIFTGFAFDELVRIYKQEKNFARLIAICQSAVDAYPDDVGLLAELGGALQKAGRFADACAAYEKLIGLEDDNSSYHCLLGDARFALGLTAEGEAAYLRAGELDPDQIDLYFFKTAGLFAKTGRYEEAKKSLAKCLAAKPENPLYHCSLGDLFVFTGKITEAFTEYEIAVKSDLPGAGAYYNRLGNILFREKHYSEAEKAFRKALEKEPGNPVYAGNLSLASKNMKSTDKTKTKKKTTDVSRKR